MMDRRAFIGTLTGGLLAAPLAAEAQQTGTVYRVGILETRSAVLNATNLDAFRRALRGLGYAEGQNLEITYRSYARPGGNVTGLSSYDVEIHAKRLDLLREVRPRLTRVAGLFNMSNRVLPLAWKEVQRAAGSLGIQAQLLDVRRPEDLPGAFDAAAKHRAEALIVGVDGVTQGNLRPIAELAAKQRLPSIYGAKEYVDFGGLITYGASDPHMYYRAATFVDKIFKGAKPADLPVEQPTTFELIINVKTAKTLGLTIPQPLLLRADEIIQ